MLNLVHEPAAKGASLRVLEPSRLVVTVLGMVADMELKFIRDRQRDGIETACLRRPIPRVHARMLAALQAPSA